MNKKIIFIGEALIDFIAKDSGILPNISTFDKKIGGAPLNAAYSASIFNENIDVYVSVGKDSFGESILNKVQSLGLDTSNIHFSNENTTLAFVSFDQENERSFEFNSGADMNLPEISETKLSQYDYFAFVSATWYLGGNLKSTYLKAYKYAKDNNKVIFFDPNYRETLLTTKDQKDNFIKSSKEFISNSDYVKLSLQELYIISGSDNQEDAISKIMSLGCKNLLITLGKEGTLVINQNGIKECDTIKIKQIDSTGAGDAFFGSLIGQISMNEDNSTLNDLVRVSNKVGAIVASNKGAIVKEIFEVVNE